VCLQNRDIHTRAPVLRVGTAFIRANFSRHARPKPRVTADREVPSTLETSHSSSDLSDHSVGVAYLNDLQARLGLVFEYRRL
jgi:hypothetical protein